MTTMSWTPYANNAQDLKKASAHGLFASALNINMRNCPEFPYTTKCRTAMGQAHVAALALLLATQG